MARTSLHDPSSAQGSSCCPVERPARAPVPARPCSCLLSPAVGFDFVPSAVSWDAFDWSEVETNGTVSVQLYYTNSTTCDTLVPDVDLSGNAAGFTSGPVDISGLDTAVYNEVCIQALLQGSGGTPYLSDWEVTYQRRVGPLKGAIIMVD